MPRKKNKKALWFILLLPPVLLLAWYYRGELRYFYYTLKPARHYKSFGVYVPEGYSTLGIDVSRYQGAINWTALSATQHNHLRLSFAYIKATEGDNIKDPFFEINAIAGKKSRLFAGAYHFYRFTDSPEAQIRFFMHHTAKHRFTLPPVLDVEDDDNMPAGQVKADLLKALQLLEQESGRRPLIYTSPSFYRRFLSNGFEDYTFWLAHYYVNRPLIPGGMNARIWQFTDKATVDGIGTPVDMNVFMGDYEEFTTLLHE